MMHFTPQPTMQHVAEAVADFYGITVDDLTGPCRLRKYTHPRQLAFAIIRDNVKGATMEAIGGFFNRDHTTVVHGVKAVDHPTRFQCRSDAYAIWRLAENALAVPVFKSRRNPPKFQTTRKVSAIPIPQKKETGVMTRNEAYEVRYAKRWKEFNREERRKSAPPATFRENGATDVEKRILARRAEVKKLHATGIMVKDIAAKLEWSLPTITEDLKQLRIQGEII